jgi:hypothetical protein
MNRIRATLIALACSLPALGLTQWQWIDKDGRKVFSDRSPPADIPAKDIIKQPSGGKGSTAAAVAPVAAASQPAKPAASVPKLTGKDKDLEEKRKLAEAADAQKKKDQEEAVAKARAENCQQAKRAKANYDSGVRISQVNAKGEREILDDAQRSAEVKRIEKIIASDCKPA